jgi:hypothetical protein
MCTFVGRPLARRLCHLSFIREALFDAVRDHLRAQGITVSTGTIVDATIPRLITSVSA